MAHPNPNPDELTPEDVAFLEAVKAADASIAQGRSISYDQVRPWLLSWGADNELPTPECP
jgi:predicted transcriptional regulator